MQLVFYAGGFFGKLGILFVIDFFWQSIVDKLFHERIFALTVFFQHAMESFFRFDSVCVKHAVFFFGSFYHHIKHLIVKVDGAKFFYELFGQGFLANIWLRAILGAVRLGASVIGMTFFDFGGDFESAFSANGKTSQEKFDFIDSLERAIWMETFLSGVKKRFGNKGWMNALVNLSFPLKQSVVERIGENAIETRLVDLVTECGAKTVFVEFGFESAQ